MAQHDQNIANQSFPAARGDINNALAAIFTLSSGSTAPSTTVAGQLWLDTSTTPNVLKQRDSSNASWVTLWQVGTADEVVLPAGSLEIKGSSPAAILNRTGAATNEKFWRWLTAGTSTAGTGRLSLATYSDAGVAGATILEIARNGTSLTGAAFNAPLFAPVGPVTATGSSNAYAVTLTPAPAALVDGLTVCMKANFTNTGSVTLNVNGLGAVQVRKLGSAQLVSGDILNGQKVLLQYDSGAGYWQMLSPVASAGAFDINGLSTATPDPANDFVPFYDASASANAKATIATLLSSAGGRFVGAQFFNANGTYTPTSGATKALVFCAGGGGSVGGSGGTSSFGSVCSATGGAQPNEIATDLQSDLTSSGSHGGGVSGDLNISGGGAPGTHFTRWRWTGSSRFGLTGPAGNGGLAIKYISSLAASYSITCGSGGGYVYVVEFA